MQNKLEFIKKVNIEFKKRNQNAVYNPLTDSIIVDSKMSFYVPHFMGVYSKENDMKKVIDGMVRFDTNMKSGWEHVNQGKVHKDCTLNSIIPCMFNPQETNVICDLFKAMQYSEKKTQEKSDQYAPLILDYVEFENMYALFTYQLDTIPFYLTIQQYKLLTNSMDIGKFGNFARSNATKKLYDELTDLNPINGFLDSKRDVYIMNLRKMTSRTFIFGASSYFDVLKSLTSFGEDHMHVYAFSETEIALLRPSIESEEFFNKLIMFDSLNRNTVKLLPFDIDSNNTGTVKFILEPVNGPASNS